jgi:ribonuclease HI
MRKAIKSQVLPDFHAEWLELQAPKKPDMSSSWTMYFDGSKRNEGAGAGIVLTSPRGDRTLYVLRVNFLNASNNEAEYEALIHGMRMANACGATRLVIYGDSNLVVQQTMKECDAPAKNMAAYRELYNTLESEFDGCELQHIGRSSNAEADKLATIGSTCAPIPPDVFYEEIDEHSIKPKPTVTEKSKPGCRRRYGSSRIN